MRGHSVGHIVIVHKDKFSYNAHPSIAVLDNGEWLAGFGTSPLQKKKRHPPEDPLYRTMLIRSSNCGETWGKPYFAPDFDWSGVDPPDLSQLRDNTVIFTQFRFGWYPLGLAKKSGQRGSQSLSAYLGKGGQKISPTRSGETHSTHGPEVTTDCTPT